jgi:hypothetical protein
LSELSQQQAQPEPSILLRIHRTSTGRYVAADESANVLQHVPEKEVNDVDITDHQPPKIKKKTKKNHLISFDS